MEQKTNEKTWSRFENHFLNEGISKNRQQKLKMVFHVVCRGFDNKPLENLKREDIEIFINSLHKNEFKRLDGQPYTGSTKSDIKKFLKQFFKWCKGDNEHYPPEVSWIKSRIAKDEKPIPENILSQAEVIKLASELKVEYRAMVLILFDSGFRISELMSVRKCDLKLDDYSDNKKCFWIKCNQSKTFVRNIPIPLFTDDLRAFVKSSYYANLSETDPLFQMSQSALTKYIKENAERIIRRKDIHAHLFRHSSATFWAKELEGNIPALCQRFGWSLSANEVKTYVRMSGAYEKVSVKKFYDNETSKLKSRVIELEEKLSAFEDNIRLMAKSITALKQATIARDEEFADIVHKLKLKNR